MGQLDAEISLPIVSKDKVIGILHLGHKEGKEIYSSEDLEICWMRPRGFIISK